jgi:hypothetical protein
LSGRGNIDLTSANLLVFQLKASVQRKQQFFWSKKQLFIAIGRLFWYKTRLFAAGLFRQLEYECLNMVPGTNFPAKFA